MDLLPTWLLNFANHNDIDTAVIILRVFSQYIPHKSNATGRLLKILATI